jgi:hypothetical protein
LLVVDLSHQAAVRVETGFAAELQRNLQLRREAVADRDGVAVHHALATRDHAPLLVDGRMVAASTRSPPCVAITVVRRR